MNKVHYFDKESQKVVKIPASELTSDAVLASIKGIEGAVWIQPSTDQQAANGQHNGFKHAPFNESVRIYIEQIQAAFAEHYPLSFKEWEDGFRRDDNASEQIAVWWYAADIYKEITASEPSPERRADIYRCVFNCMIGSRDTFWETYQSSTLSCSEAQRIVDRYYMVTPLNGTN